MNGTLFLILQQGYDEQHRQAMAEYAQHAPEFAAAYAAQAAQAFAKMQADAYAAAEVLSLSLGPVNAAHRFKVAVPCHVLGSARSSRLRTTT